MGQNCRLGVPHVGSKNKIARWVVEQLPAAEVFVDLFAGGCAVTQAAIESGKWSRFICNDLGQGPEVFAAACRGDFEGYATIPTHEEFNALKDGDIVLALVNSFGSNATSYAYGPDYEEVKVYAQRMIHAPSVYERRTAYRRFITSLQRYAEEHGSDSLARVNKTNPMERGDGLTGLSSSERIDGLNKLSGTDISRVTFSRCDYRDVPIPDNATVYADPPYRSTMDGNARWYEGQYSPEAFDRWLSCVNHLVYVSEYDCPAGCIEVASRRKTVSMASGTTSSKGLRRVERIFLQERFATEAEKMQSELRESAKKAEKR